MSGKVFVFVLIVLVAAVGAFRFWPSDERAIRQQLAVIEEAGSKEPAEKSIEALFKAKQIAALFSDPCQLTVASASHAGEYPRKQIQDRLLMVRGFYTQAKVSLHDITIDITPEKTAVVRGTIRLRGEGAGGKVADVHELRAEMRSIDGKWLFTTVEIVQVLER
ncbi:hypothetical protein [uncultured Desulfobulbus sp.]|uniref:hypothetical protein n=1 Tax=uncultured Desulfobulbus sp. TaxID=239745 RepID=UPI0029C801FE|nr:hypothetical protein [uncultured Desulfobulbus sp.]